MILPLEPGSSVPEEPSRVPLRVPHGERCVLIVDDQPVNRLVAARMVESLGYAACQVEDGASAVARVASGGVHAVLMDLHMPGMDGFEATRRIRQVADVPVVALTADALVGDRERTREAGFVEHLAKPIEVKALQRVLGGLFAAGQAQDQGSASSSPGT